MTTLNVYWKLHDFDAEQQQKREGMNVRTGYLTDEHEAATPEIPVLVEERSFRVFRPDDLPPETVLYVEEAPGDLPPLAEKARNAGFVIEHA
jgi:hypothetical protein